jgi:dipeptidyl aminopeptidase/acylaminoacyl peptidase
MKIYCFLLLILLPSCTQVPIAPTLDINYPLPTAQNIATVDTHPLLSDLNINGRILVYTPKGVYLANADGTSPALIHTIESPLPMMSLSPDGTKFAYFSDNSLYVKDIITGIVSTWNREMMGSIGGQLRWSPDSKKIALACSTPNVPTTSLCLVDESGNIEYLIKEENIADKTVSPEYFIEIQDWSRDGSKLVFLYYSPSEKGQKQDFSIYYYDVVSKITQLILDGKKQNMIFQIKGVNISPDNKTLLISSIGENSLPQIFVLDISVVPLQLQQLPIQQLPNASYTNPVWSSDNCCYYIHVEQDGFYQHTLLADLTGNVILNLDIQGTILQWVK